MESISEPLSGTRAGGAVYVEFALVLPIFLLFIAGLFELARVQNELVWLNQSAYQLALTGATHVKVQGDEKIREAYEKIKESSHGHLTISLIEPENQAKTHYSDLPSGKTIVTVKLYGEVNSIFSWLFGKFMNTSMTAVVPYLYLSKTYAPDNIQPTNPSTTLTGSSYCSGSGDCRNGVCSPAPANSCITAGDAPYF